jgi:signal transduction histidine kinase
MFSKSRTDAASDKPAQRSAQRSVQKKGSPSSGSAFRPVRPTKSAKPGKGQGVTGFLKSMSEPQPSAFMGPDPKKVKRAADQTAKRIAKAAKESEKARKTAAKTAAAAAVSQTRADKKAAKDKLRLDEVVYAPGEKPSPLNLSEWSLRRKVALVLAVPVILAATFGGLRIRTEKLQADNYAASADQVTVLGPAVKYLDAAEQAAIISRQVGINDPKLDAAQQAVVEAGAALISARDKANLTPTQLRQVNDVISLSEQMRNGMAYVSVTSSVSQVRQLERGITQVITTIVDAEISPDPTLPVLAQALDGRLSLSLQAIQVANEDTVPANPVELYSEFGVELASIDRLAISLGQTDSRVLAIRQANAQRVVNARGGNTKISSDSYGAYDNLIDDLVTKVHTDLSNKARNAKVLTWVDSAIIGGALLAALILAFLISRLLLNPIRRVRSGALEVAHQRLPEAVARIRAGEEPGEIVPIAVTTHEETGQLARAVDDLHRQAVKLASGEAALRAQVGDMFVTLSRRNTSLINQQLALIETLESDEEDPQRLESLFRLDHLAARMRRNADSLVILSGANTRTAEADDLSLTDVLQAAIAGVQDYRRVQLDAAPAQRVHNEAAADVVHVLSELVDNALSYSPPSSKVLVTSSFTRGGVIVQITDGGLGIADDTLAELNERLRSGGEVTPDTARRMGLFVVSRLAQRHGLSVSLDQNDRMGITATVFLPTSVLTDTARLAAAPSAGQYAAQPGYPESGYDNGDGQIATVNALGAAPLRAVEDEESAYAEPVRPEPGPDLDPITAAINAYGLPQRRPGASGAGRAGVTSPESMGGGFFERAEPDEEPGAEVAHADSGDGEDIVDAVVAEDLPEHEVQAAADVEADELDELDELDEPDEVLAEVHTLPVPEADEQADEQAEETGEHDQPAAADDALEEEASASVVLDPVPQLDELDETGETGGTGETGETTETEATDESSEGDGAGQDELAPVLATLPLPESVPFQVDDAVATNGNGNGNGNGHPSTPAAVSDPESLSARLSRLSGLAARNAEALADGRASELADGTAAAAANGFGALDSRTPAPMGSTDDDSPIFRSLQSNWLTADSGERPWADSEVDAGWDAADRVEAAPPTRRTEAGLPMRRPGNRLIPGGLSAPAAVPTVRDPDAIRARLAAHAAGVSRGRTAATVTEPTTQEADPA